MLQNLNFCMSETECYFSFHISTVMNSNILMADRCLSEPSEGNERQERKAHLQFLDSYSCYANL